MLSVTTAVIFVTSARPPEYWLPTGARLSIRLRFIPVRKVMARQEDMSQKVEDLNHSAGKIFFLMKTLLLYLFDHLAVDFVH